MDGNGRLSRVLTNLMLLRAGYAYASYTSLESVIEYNKERATPNCTAKYAVPTTAG